jgi:curved DNA-binding protein CbpA
MIMSNLDYYQVLQVEPNATPGDIREAYYRLAQKRYDQRGKDIETAVPIQQVSDAYTILGNPYRRAIYDLERKNNSPQDRAESAAAKSAQSAALPGRRTASKRIQWYLMAGILLLGIAVILSARSLGQYWLPVLMIVMLCVVMNLFAMFLSRNLNPDNNPYDSDESKKPIHI